MDSAAATLGQHRDRQATTKRLLAAARVEFAERGLAGARIDRISHNAGANKRLLYAYLGNKDAVFSAVVTDCVAELNSAVPFSPDNMPEYAGQVLDFFLAHPLIRRVLEWRDVEDAEPTPLEVRSYRRKLTLIAAAQRDEILDNTLSPLDLLAIVESTIESWLGATVGLRATGGKSNPRRLAENRAAVVETIRRITSRE